MTIVSALFLLFTQTTSTSAPTDYDDFLSLINDLDRVVEWIDQDVMQTLTKQQAQHKLKTLASGLTQDQIKVQHSSKWKNGQCFRIVLLMHGSKTYRLYFQCTKDVDDDQLVTKIKVSEM